MESSGFFKSLEEDRKYLAKQFADYFATFIGNGVFGAHAHQLKVYQHEGMTVRINDGNGFLNGYWYRVDNSKTITTKTIPYNTTTSTMNVYIKMVLDEDEERKIQTIVSTDASVSATEKILAIIVVPPGATTITNDMIQDTRFDSTKCGVVKGLIDEIDTTDFFNQYTTALEKQLQENEKAYTTQMSRQQSDWSEQTLNQQSDWSEQTLNQQSVWSKQTQNQQTAWSQQLTNQKDAFNAQSSKIQSEADKQLQENDEAFQVWWEELQVTLGEDVAAQLKLQIGTLAELVTDDKTNLVKAINEVYNRSVMVDSVSGVNPTADQSTDGNVIYLKNSGYTKQNTLSGKNVINPDNFVAVDDGTVTVVVDGSKLTCSNSGTSDKIVTIYNVADIPLSPDDDVRDAPTGKVGLLTMYTKSSISLNNASIYKEDLLMSESFNPDTSSYESYTTYRIPLYSFTGSIIESIQITIPAGTTNREIYFQLEVVDEVTTEIFEYEPYCGGVASPNPEYPQEIKGLGDNGTIEVRTRGKNLLKSSAFSKTAYGITFTVNSDKSITINGTSTANADIGLFSLYRDTTHDLIANERTVKILKTNVTGVDIIAGNGKTVYGIASKNSHSNYIPYTNKISWVLLRITEGITVANQTVYPMIISSDETDDTYEPYIETQALIPISAPLYDGDYIEVYADGSGQIYRDMHHITVAKDAFNKVTSATGKIYYESKEMYPADYYGVAGSKNGKMYCNMSSDLSNPDSDVTGKAWVYTISGNTVSKCRISTDVYEALSDTQNIEFVYRLKTPTSTPLTAEQVAEFMKLQTFKGVTHVNADGEVTVRYYCNNDSGDTVARLSGEISSVSDKFSSDVEEMREDIETVSAYIEEQIEIKGCWEAYGDWTEGDKAGSTALKSVAYGNYRFVAVNNAGMPYYSFDGSKWFDGIITNTSALNSVTYGNGLFVAVGASGVTFYSEDGITWIAGDKVSSGVYLTSVTYGNGIFVAVGYSAGVYYSEDGVTWNTANGIPTISNLIFNGVTYGGGRFVVVGTGNAYFSLDGKTWSSGQYGGNTVLISVTYGNGRFVAVGYDGVTYYADNGASWIPGGTAGNTTLYSVTYGDGLFVVVDVSGTTYYSEDGVTWTEGGSAGSGALYGITYGKNRFVAVGTSSATYYKEKDNIAESVKDLCQTVSDITQSVTDLSNTNTYSSEEVVCGTWLGKTLYQKTFSVSALEETPHSLDDVEQIWIDDTMSFYEFINGSTSSISGSTATCTVDKTNIMFSDIGNTSMLSTAYITLKYIKLS